VGTGISSRGKALGVLKFKNEWSYTYMPHICLNCGDGKKLDLLTRTVTANAMFSAGYMSGTLSL
jgi:hypothetical protein